MKWRYWLPAAAPLVIGVVWYGYSYYMDYVTDDFDTFLEANGYNTLRPPRDGFVLGSLYEIGDDGNLGVVCAASAQAVDPFVEKSHGARTSIKRAYGGTFSAGSEVTDVLKGLTGGSYDKKVSLRLSSVELNEIPLSKDSEIRRKLMQDNSCHDTVFQLIRLGRYVCQARSSFKATLEYQFDAGHESQASSSTAETETAVHALATAVKVHTTAEVEIKNGGQTVETGSSLVFGAGLDPICITPDPSVFIRTWPRTWYQRLWNYARYQFVEPLMISTYRR